MRKHATAATRVIVQNHSFITLYSDKNSSHHSRARINLKKGLYVEKMKKSISKRVDTMTRPRSIFEELRSIFDESFSEYETETTTRQPPERPRKYAAIVRNGIVEIIDLEELERQGKKDPEKKATNNLEYILAPLDEIFLEPELKDGIISAFSIPQLLHGAEPEISGAILHGPPGTGKTVLLRAINEVYDRAGAYSEEVSLAAMNSKYVGEFAQNIDNKIARALKEAKRRGKPSFLSFDEASSLAEQSNLGAESVSKHYQETMDVMKKYVGNERMIVLGITTNSNPRTFDHALTREGRLRTFNIDYPDEEQRQNMWSYFLKKHVNIELTAEEAKSLAETTPKEQGAFIDEFCRTYVGMRTAGILKERGYTLFDALKKNITVPREEVMSSVTPTQILTDLNNYVEGRHKNGRKSIAGYER